MSDNNNSNTSHIVLGLLGAFAFACMACCGVGGWYFYQGVQSVKQMAGEFSENFVVNPIEIEKGKLEISEIEIPIQLMPQMMMRDSFMESFGDEESAPDESEPTLIKNTAVTIQYISGTGNIENSLTLAGFIDPPYEEADREEQQEKLKSLAHFTLKIPEDDPQAEPGEYSGKATEVIEREIRGETAKFVLRSMRGESQENPETWDLEAEFEGKHAPARLKATLRGADFTRDEVIAIIDSIK